MGTEGSQAQHRIYTCMETWKKWNKKPKKKKEMGVFNFIRFIPIYLLSQQLNPEPPNLEEEVWVYHSQE